MEKKWKDADSITSRLMKKAAGCNEGLTIEDMGRFPCDDLRIIDRLGPKPVTDALGLARSASVFTLAIMTKKGSVSCWVGDGTDYGSPGQKFSSILLHQKDICLLVAHTGC